MRGTNHSNFDVHNNRNLSHSTLKAVIKSWVERLCAFIVSCVVAATVESEHAKWSVARVFWNSTAWNLKKVGFDIAMELIYSNSTELRCQLVPTWRIREHFRIIQNMGLTWLPMTKQCITSKFFERISQHWLR